MSLREEAVPSSIVPVTLACQSLNYRVMDEHKCHAVCSGVGHADVPEGPEPAGLNTDERLASGWGGVM
jgi:hypothetical protein